MSKSKKSLYLFLAAILAFTLVITVIPITGCKATTAETTTAVTTAAETTAADITATETTAAETQTSEVKLSGSITVGQTSDWLEMKPRWDKIKEFEDATGVKVNRVDTPMDAIKQKYLLDATFAKGSYDIYTIWDGVYGLFYPHVMSLNKFIERDFKMTPKEFVSQYAESLQNLIYFNGEVKYLPFFLNVQTGIYRKDLFEDPNEQAAFKKKYGYELKQPETLQQLLDIAQFFTRDTENGKMWGLVMPLKGAIGGSIFEDLLYRTGLAYFDPDSSKNDWHIMWGKPENRQKAIDVAQFELDLIYKYKVMPKGAITYEFVEIPELYLAGNIAMAYSWLPVFRSKFDAPDAVAKIGKTGWWIFPSWNPGSGGFHGFWAQGISAYSQNPEAAWAFLKWAHSEEFFKEQTKQSPWTPALKSIQDWAIKENVLPPEMVKVAEGTRVFPPIPEMDSLRNIVNTNHEAMISGQLTPTEFVDKSVKEMEAILEQAGYYK